MTNETTTPKKSNRKKLLIITALVFGFLYIDYSKLHFVLGSDEVNSSSSSIIADSSSSMEVKADTTKSDTTKK